MHIQYIDIMGRGNNPICPKAIDGGGGSPKSGQIFGGWGSASAKSKIIHHPSPHNDF